MSFKAIFFKYCMYFILFSFLTYLSCNRSGVQNNEVRIPPKQAEGKAKASAFFKSVDYVSLKTPSGVNIGNISNIELNNENIFVLDKQSNLILRFDRAGNLINPIPQNFRINSDSVYATTFAISNWKVYLLNSKASNTYVYSYSGDLLEVINYDFNPSGIEYYDDHLFFFCPMPIANETNNHSIIRYTEKSKSFKKLNKRSITLGRTNISERYTIFKDEHGLAYWNSVDDKIINVSGKFNWSNYKFIYKDKPTIKVQLSKQLRKAMNKHCLVTKINIFNSIAFIDFLEYRYRTPIIFDKNSNTFIESNTAGGSGYSLFGLENDIDDGMLIWPDYCTNHEAIQIIEPIEFRNFLYDRINQGLDLPHNELVDIIMSPGNLPNNPIIILYK